MYKRQVLALDLSGFDSIRAQLAQEFDGLAVEAAQFSVESVGTFSAYETLGDFNARQLDESRRQTRILEDVRDVLRSCLLYTSPSKAAPSSSLCAVPEAGRRARQASGRQGAK